MKTLVLITSNFPFGTGEPFIETELPFLSAGFIRVIIISQNYSSGMSREIPGDIKVYRYNPSTSLSGFITLPVLLSKNLKLIVNAFHEEMKFRGQIGFKLSLKQKLFLIKKIIKAVQLRDFINIVLVQEQLKTDIVLYSFWMNSGAHAISLLKIKPYVAISRAHASDLYEEKSPLGFLPLLKFTSDRLNNLFFASEHGRKYFVSKTGSEDDHLKISKLGVSRLFPLNTSPIDPGKPFTMVSCSNLIPLKRIDLIIKSLELVTPEREIRWIHFGDGRLRTELKKMAAAKLENKKMCSFDFRGYIAHQEILKFYSTDRVDLFINTSSTEGTPVSIMEAQSYGIPVIATNVGAVSELVTEGTGSLLPVDFEPEDLAKLIRMYMDKQPADIMRMSERIVKNWQTKSNADINYPDFISQVISIFGSSVSRTAGIK